MVYGYAKKNRRTPTWRMLEHCIMRNFGGLEISKLEPLKIFTQKLNTVDQDSLVSTFLSIFSLLDARD